MTSVAAPVQARLERALLRATPGVIVLVSADLVVEHAAPDASASNPSAPRARAGGALLDLVHPEDRLLVVESIEQARADAQSLRVRWATPDGGWVTCDARCHDLLDDPTVAAYLVVLAPLATGDPLVVAFGELAARLTPREREVVGMVADGYRVSTIARELGLAASTVRNHLSAIFQKLGVGNQGQLVERLARAAGRG